MDPKARRTLTLAGRAWIYELQEGIFLLCHDQVELEDEKVGPCCFIPMAMELTETAVIVTADTPTFVR